MMKKIVLFGTGLQAEKFAFECGKDFDIQYVVDFEASEKKFLGTYDVQKANAENCSKFFLVVAGDYYRSKIIPFLSKMGMKELEDYIWYEWNDKKIVVLNANCYGPQIKKYLQADTDFNSNFAFYPVPTICENKQKSISEHIMKKCSIFIHQDIRVQNAFGYKLSDEYLMKQLPPHALSITIPNLVGFGTAFYPQSDLTNKRSRPYPNAANGLFPHADKVIDHFCEEGNSVEEILYKCRDGEIFSKQKIVDGLNENYRKFKQREEKWDIKVLDMIMDLHRDTQVFYDGAHPANFIIRYICENILDRLGIHKKLDLYGNGLNLYENPVYPDVKEALMLSWGGAEAFLRKDSPFKLTKRNMDMEEYIKEYVFWCYTDRFMGRK